MKPPGSFISERFFLVPLDPSATYTHHHTWDAFHMQKPSCTSAHTQTHKGRSSKKNEVHKDPHSIEFRKSSKMSIHLNYLNFVLPRSENFWNLPTNKTLIDGLSGQRKSFEFMNKSNSN
jgi:hypothetical protein